MDLITEQEYLRMANDCKNRMTVKSEKIKELTKIIFTLYGLCRSGLEREDWAFIEESRSVISEFFDEEFFDN